MTRYDVDFLYRLLEKVWGWLREWPSRHRAPKSRSAEPERTPHYPTVDNPTYPTHTLQCLSYGNLLPTKKDKFRFLQGFLVLSACVFPSHLHMANRKRLCNLSFI